MVNTTTLKDQQRPAIATLKDGSVVICWVGVEPVVANMAGIFGQRLTSSLTKLGNEFRVDPHPNLLFRTNPPVVAALEDGGFAVSFVSLVSPSSFPSNSNVLVQRFDAAGQKEGEVVAGEHVVRWDGRDELGKTVASNVYFCMMEAREFRAARKLLLLR